MLAVVASLRQRERCLDKSVEKCIMVDIDEVVVNICKEELPEWGQGCTEDPRLTVEYDDARAYLERYEGKFDVIIMDIADPIEAGLATFFTPKSSTSLLRPSLTRWRPRHAVGSPALCTTTMSASPPSIKLSAPHSSMSLATMLTSQASLRTGDSIWHSMEVRTSVVPMQTGALLKLMP